MRQYAKGITLVEILVGLTIVIILTSITMVSMSAYRAMRLVETAANEIAFKLEQAKADAMSGKNGTSYGIHFASTSYTYFRGSTYSTSDTNNISPAFSNELTIQTQLTGGSSNIVFSRITGTPSANGTIVISKTNDPARSKTITVGALGDVSVVQ